MTKQWFVAAAVIVAALMLYGCCGIPFPGGNAQHANVTGLTGRDGTAVANGGTTTERVQHIAGTVDNPGGNDATIFSGRVAVVLNGQKQYVTDMTRNDDGTWDFGADFVIGRGTNNVVVQVEDANGGAYGQSDTFTVTGNLPARQVEVVLTWDTNLTDVDMHVYAPGYSSTLNSDHTWYQALNGISGCNLDLDKPNAK